MSTLNVRNRTLAIMDNLTFLRSLNNECIDLIAIDPPFAANDTFTSQPKPPITEAELAEERALAKRHGVSHNEGVGETRVKDVWNWDEDVHPAWKMRIEDDYPAVHAVIQAVEACASENEAAYIAYMAVRLIECHRVLKETGAYTSTVTTTPTATFGWLWMPFLGRRMSRAAAKHTTVAKRKCTTGVMGDGSDLGVSGGTGTVES